MGQAAKIGARPYRHTHKKPWGSYRVLDSGSGYQIKQLTIASGHATSLQIHKHRDERWVVISGIGMATRGEQQIKLSEGSTVFIPFGMMHRLEADLNISLQIIEVQYGDYLDEDDIVRLEDRYGRETSKH